MTTESQDLSLTFSLYMCVCSSVEARISFYQASVSYMIYGCLYSKDMTQSNLLPKKTHRYKAASQGEA